MSHDVQFDGQFAEKVLVHLEAMCQEFLESIPYKLATQLTEEHPDLGHYSVMQAVDRFVQPDGDGSRDKAKEWLGFRTRDITAAFEAEFNQDDEDDDCDEDDNSDEYVAHADAVEREGMFDAEEAKFDAYTRHTYDANYTRPMLLSELAEIQRKAERKSRYFWRTIRWHDNGLEERVQFCQYDDYIEDSLEDQATHYYGESPDVAVVGYGNDEWVIVEN